MEHGAHSGHHDTAKKQKHESHYGRLGVMTALSFIAMYILMYAMVDRLANVYMNFNQVYMAGLMAAPMVLIELVVMRKMYGDKRMNALMAGGAVIAGIAFFLFIRQQTAVGDRQFLRSMIPHHGAAILMCKEAPVRDAEIRSLCQNIITSQQAEIDLMKAMLER
jgi:hypothetical protein